MAFRSLQFTPGLNTQLTPTMNRSGWSYSNLIRFPASSGGLPEVVGGWQPFFSPSAQLQGVCRGLHSWATLDGDPTLAAGTTARLYVAQGGVPYDVTPAVHTSALVDPFSTVSGSPTVTVADGGYSPTPGQLIEVSGSTTVGGLAMNGEHTVVTVGVGTFTFTAGSNAGSTVTGGGVAVSIAYLLAPGQINQGGAFGWGQGAWGYPPGWGTPRTQTSVTTYPSTWELDNWGQNLVAVRRASTVFAWENNVVLNRATPITYAPPQANGVLVAMPEQQLIVWGSSVPNPVAKTWGAQDPMVIVWTDFSDYTQQQSWFASATNAAGSFRLTQGSQIMTCMKSQGQILVWTDTALAAMQFVNVPFIYGFQQLGNNCGLVAPKAAGVIGGKAFWWSDNEFFEYNGTAEPLPCPVRDITLNNVNKSQRYKICCSINSQFSEVQWEFPSANSTENDSYVAYNYVNHTWSYGTLTNGVAVGRTARIDINVFGFPIAADASGNVWLHEDGYTADGSSMPWEVDSGYADIAEGESFVFADYLIPDGTYTAGNIGITIKMQNFPTDTPNTAGPYNAGLTQTFVPFRLRGRQIAFRFANDNNVTGLFWRLGRVRVRVAPDGRQ